MHETYKNNPIDSHMNHLKDVLEKEVFTTLKKYCKNDKSLMLLLPKEAIDKTMQKTRDSGRKFICKELSSREKELVPNVPLLIPDSLKFILGPDTFSLLQQYCLWNEEIMIMVLNKAIEGELKVAGKEASND